jgi:hypothetical protein
MSGVLKTLAERLKKCDPRARGCAGVQSTSSKQGWSAMCDLKRDEMLRLGRAGSSGRLA